MSVIISPPYDYTQNGGAVNKTMDTGVIKFIATPSKQQDRALMEIKRVNEMNKPKSIVLFDIETGITLKQVNFDKSGKAEVAFFWSHLRINPSKNVLKFKRQDLDSYLFDFPDTIKNFCINFIEPQILEP